MDALQATLTAIQAQLSSLDKHLLSLESGKRSGAASVVAVTTTSIPTTQGKKKAKAAPAAPKPSKAKEPRSTPKATTLPDLPLHLAQTFPQEGKPDRHPVTVAIPDASAAHVIRQGGQGLKQIHDISGARVSAYTLVAGSRDERHVSIRGTDIQIGDALVVLRKRLARKCVCNPKVKSKSSVTAAPPPSQAVAAKAPPLMAWGGGAASPPFDSTPAHPVISDNLLVLSPCYLLQPHRQLPPCLEQHRLHVQGRSRSCHPRPLLWPWDHPRPLLHSSPLRSRWEAPLLLVVQETSLQCKWTWSSSTIPTPL